MKKGFDYEKQFMGLPNDDSQTGTFKIGSKYEFRLWTLIKDINLTRGKILDVGCGAGGFVNSLKHHYPEFECYGCDISQAAIRFAKKHRSHQIDFQVIKDGKLPYSNNYFDFVILIHVFEHVEKRDKLLKEIYRVLKKGGIFHIQVPCEANPLTFAKFKWGQRLTRKYWGHVHPITDQEMISYMRKYKFKVIRKCYDSHFLSQFLLLVTYFLPKVTLDFFLGEERALEYTDTQVKTRKKPGPDFLLHLRKIWIKLSFWLTSIIKYLEFIILGSTRLTALNLHLTCQKI